MRRNTLVLDGQLFEILPQLRVCMCVYICENGCSKEQQLSLEADSRGGIVTQATFPRILSCKDSRDIKSDIYWGTCAG